MNRNADVLAWLRELAYLSVLEDENPQSFRGRAYERAMHALEGYTGDIEQLTKAQLMKMSGIGKATASKIREYFDTGTVAKLETLREKHPLSVVEMSRIPGIGPKKVAQLRKQKDIHDVDALKQAIADGSLTGMKGWGQKTVDKIEKAIERLGWKEERRTPVVIAMRVAARMADQLAELDGVVDVVPCGSLRRLRETVGDIDIVVASSDPQPVMDFVRDHTSVKHVIGSGETKTSILTHQGIQIDVRVVAPDQLGAATMYFTGSKAHNIRLRQRALDKGWTLNEYALSVQKTEEVVAAQTEEAIYDALGLPWIPPPMREDTGEIEAALDGTLPEWLTEEDLQGDLHVHTTYSGDGRSPLSEMIAAIVARGYGYVGITDHGEDLAINGISRDDLARQADEMEGLREQYPDLLLMRGCELNIGPDGGLDYDPDFRAELDWCIAAVHNQFDLSQADQTKRLIRAIQDPTVRVIAHLTGRMIGRRPGIEIDVDAVLDALVEYDVALELNSALPRLDAAAPVLRRAMDKGVLVVVSTDAHHVKELNRTRWGAMHAQRGWLDKKQVLNTWDRERFDAWRLRST